MESHGLIVSPVIARACVWGADYGASVGWAGDSGRAGRTAGGDRWEEHQVIDNMQVEPPEQPAAAPLAPGAFHVNVFPFPDDGDEDDFVSADEQLRQRERERRRQRRRYHERREAAAEHLRLTVLRLALEGAATAGLHAAMEASRQVEGLLAGLPEQDRPTLEGIGRISGHVWRCGGWMCVRRCDGLSCRWRPPDPAHPTTRHTRPRRPMRRHA